MAPTRPYEPSGRPAQAALPAVHSLHVNAPRSDSDTASAKTCASQGSANSGTLEVGLEGVDADRGGVV